MVPRTNASRSLEDARAFIREQGLSRFAVYPYLSKTKQIRPGEPEESVRLELYNELIFDYGYPPERIDIEFPVLIREDEQPRFADIVVFADDAHRRPFIVVEAKRPRRVDGERQGQRYATILRAVYVLWSNGSQRACSELVNRYPEEAVSIVDIPAYLGDVVRAIAELYPFRDDRHIADIFRKCHSLIRNLSHLKPDDAFNEFLKILLVKLQDEARGEDYEFQIFRKGDDTQPEPSNETAQRIRQIFKIAAEEDGEVSSVFQKGDDINLTNDCITHLVSELQSYSFATTPVDQKGRAFESFISGDMRQEFKEFMTPRVVVNAMVAMADPDTGTTIYDPCCGSAAFLISSLQYVQQKISSRANLNDHQKIKRSFDFAHDRLWGVDASLQMSSVARINMLVNDDGRSHIFLNDSLKPKAAMPDNLRLRTFNLILTNPPFGKKVPAKSALLDHFELAKDGDGRRITKGSLLTEILFLERDLEWLAPAGKLFMVLPDSVLGNTGLSAAREFIERHARLLAVISLPADTFGPSGAKTKTSFVVLEKRHTPLLPEEYDDYDVFVGVSHDVGYDFTGRATGRNDLASIVKCFKEGTEIHNAKRVRRIEFSTVWLAQNFFQSERGGDGENPFFLLRDVCESISTGKTASRLTYTSSGVHLVKVGNLTNQGITWDAVERQYVTADFAAKYSKAQLKNGDVLFTAAAHGPKWIGLKVDLTMGILTIYTLRLCIAPKS